MYRIGIISIYFGTLPEYFNLWLDSCRRNPSIDFILITDCNVVKHSDNVKVVRSSLRDIRERFESCLGTYVALDLPYKLCDYRPMYGIVFQDILTDYDFWGHCDIDLIWGDLGKFVTNDILEANDKIFTLGHLSIYRNTPKINNAYKLAGSQRGDFEYVISTNKSCVFDERYGIDRIFEVNNLPMYSRETAADIGFRNSRMIIAGIQNRNYNHQLFTYEDGHCYRYYMTQYGMKRDEFSYIHLQKRPYSTTVNSDRFIVAQNEFIPFNGDITPQMIYKYNPFKGRIYEWIEYHYKDLSFRIGRRFKQLFIK